MTRLKVGVIGAGLISQVEHIPNILGLPDRFELVGVADPSQSNRRFLEARYGIRTFHNHEALFREAKPVAVVVASPEATHYDAACYALEQGAHVLCEKPLCYLDEQIADLIDRREKSRLIFQVAYMKRWDPTVELLCEMIRGQGDKLRFIGVEVNDPDYWPFVEQHATSLQRDLPEDMIRAGANVKRTQLRSALGGSPDDFELFSFANPFCASMIHDVNLIHGLCDAMGIETCRPLAAAFFADGWGGSCLLSLNQNQAVAQVSHVTVPALADYLERVSLFFDDCRWELRFPSPYLNSHPTELVRLTSQGHLCEKTEFRSNYQEAFVRELQGFHEAIVGGNADRNSLEDARRDMRLLVDASRLAVQARRSSMSQL